MNNTGDEIPKHLIVDLSEVYNYLDSANDAKVFPTLDVESIVAQIVDYLEKPYSGNYVCANTESRLIARMALAESITPASEGPYDISRLATVIDLSIMACHRILAMHRAYIENRLPYEYAYRRNKRIALFVKRHIVLPNLDSFKNNKHPSGVR
jgi:hypothetical protein